MCEIPIDPEVGKSGDQGKPIVESNPDNEIKKIYLDIARKSNLLLLKINFILKYRLFLLNKYRIQDHQRISLNY